MMRHAASAANVASALGWPSEKVAGFVLGHGESLGESHAPVQGPRLAFIPLPSIESRDGGRAKFVGSIRRALIVTALADRPVRICNARAAPLRCRSHGGGPGRPRGAAQPHPGVGRRGPSLRRRSRDLGDRDAGRSSRLRRSPQASAATVRRSRVRRSTRDEPGQKELLAKLDRRIDYLLRKAIRQAGYSDELAQDAELEWRSTGFLPGTDLATRYAYPEKLRRFRRLHVQITWRAASGQAVADARSHMPWWWSVPRTWLVREPVNRTIWSQQLGERLQKTIHSGALPARARPIHVPGSEGVG